MNCPDCSATTDAENHLAHDDGCPMSNDLERVCAEDAAWFDAHPNATERHREASWSERVETGATHVRVVYLGPGVRARMPYSKAR